MSAIHEINIHKEIHIILDSHTCLRQYKMKAISEIAVVYNY